MPIGGGTWPRRNARISAQLSLRLDARLADDFPPLRYFRPEAGGALLGRAGDRLVTERRQAFLQVRPDDGLCNVPLPPRGDVPGRPRRRTGAAPPPPPPTGGTPAGGGGGAGGPPGGRCLGEPRAPRSFPSLISG